MQIPLDMTTHIIESTYEQGMNHLRTRVSFIFDNPKLHHVSWEISTWSKKVARSEILKHGTEQDISNLPEASNNTRRQPAKRNRPVLDDARRKVPNRNRLGAVVQDDNSDQESSTWLTPQ